MKILQVALDVPLDTLFDYSIGDCGEVGIGDRVLVSFGRRKMVGVVTTVSCGNGTACHAAGGAGGKMTVGL